MKKLIISCTVILVVLLSMVSVVGCGSTPAAFSVSNLSTEPQEVHPNEAVTISVSVANTGSTDGSYTATLKINDVQEADETVTIAAGDTETVSFSVTRDEVGSYNVVVDGLTESFTVVPTPAAFSVSNLSIEPRQVHPNEAVTISVSVANTGGTDGSYTATLKINYVQEADETVTIAAGDTERVSFSVTREDAGTYTVAVDGLSGSFTVMAAAEVRFPDSNLEAAIRDALGKPAGEEIRPEELAGLTELEAPHSYIADLSGLEYCTNLAWLDLTRNQINDVSPLSNLTSLTVLGLYGNEISDISPLSNLTNLAWLDLSYNQISDISPLSNLTSLTKLWLYDNQISDISPLSNLTSLTELWLGDNQISDISPLASLTNITQLDLSENQISDISPLASLTNLTKLWLLDNQISDLLPLASLTNLTWLLLEENQISDLLPLASLTNLTALSLGDNQISDILPLVENSGLGTGDEVWLGDNNLDPSEGSEDMENIRALEDRGVVVHY